MKNLGHLFFLCLLIIFIANSCDIKDYTDFKEVKVLSNPEIAIPLAYGNMNVSKLINSFQTESTLFGEKANGDITIIYNKKNFFDYAVKDMVKLDKNIKLGTVNFQVGSIDLDFNYDYSITLGRMIEELEGDIQQLRDSDGKATKFPAYEYIKSPPTGFVLDNIDQFDHVTFESGKLIIELTNRLPVFGIFIDADLFDNLSNKTISNLSFGYKDRYPGYDIYYSNEYFAGNKFGLPGSLCTAGGSPGSATEQIEIDLAGITFSNQLSINLKRLYTDGSGGITPIIHFSDDLFFKLKFVDAKVESGRFKVPNHSSQPVTEKFENLNLAEGNKLHKVEVNAGIMELNLSKTLPVSGTIHLTFPGITRTDGTKLKIDKPFDEKTSFTYLIDLAKTSVNFSDNDQNPFNTLYYTYSVDINKSGMPVIFSSTDNFNFGCNLKNIDIASAEGDFGQKIITINPSSLSIFPESFNKIDGNLNFLNPIMRLIVHNAVSAPAKVDMNMQGSNMKGEVASLNPLPFSLPYPNYPLQTDITGAIEFNKGNSKIDEFLALPPTQSILYQGNIKFNPDGAPVFNKLNYIRTNSKISFDLELEVPVAFSSSQINVTDTIAFDGNKLKNLLSGELNIKTDNGIPLGMEVELNFIDSLKGTIYGLPVKSILLEAAKVDDNGIVNGHTIANHSIVLTEDQIIQYRQANAIKVKTTFYSPEKGNKPTRLNGSGEFFINIGLKAKVDLNF